jgi:hypothetical protein
MRRLGAFGGIHLERDESRHVYLEGMTMLQIGQTVNGYTIIATAVRVQKVSENYVSPDEYVILGKKGPDYVTAIMRDETDKEWYWGHYFHFRPYEYVLDDFLQRVKI